MKQIPLSNGFKIQSGVNVGERSFVVSWSN